MPTLSTETTSGEVVSVLINNGTIRFDCGVDLRISTVVQSVDILILERFEEY